MFRIRDFVQIRCFGDLGRFGDYVWRICGEILDCCSYSFRCFLGGLVEDLFMICLIGICKVGCVLYNIVLWGIRVRNLSK